jgi:dipeptidyl aminopeptidase/acylaminoacyl peptidase
MMRRFKTCLVICIVALAAVNPLAARADDNKVDAGKKAARDDVFRPMDVFQIEHASDPRISPDGKQVVYVRNMMDVMKDRRRSNLWIINIDGSEHRPLITGKHNDSMPRWSPDGKRLVYFSTADGTPQLYCRWMDSGQIAKLTDCTSAPVNPVWSPDGH